MRHLQLEARAECFNCFNHTNYANPGGAINRRRHRRHGTRATAHQLDHLRNHSRPRIPPRILQLSLKMDF